MGVKALRILAGPRAREHLRQQGLKPADVRLMAGAAGGPKGLVLNPLDRFIFGHWLAGSAQVIDLLGASIGAWRMACALRPDPDAALARLAQEYIHQRYPRVAGKPPRAEDVSDIFAQQLQQQFGGHEAQMLAHPTRRLHVLTSQGRGLLRREGPWRTPLGYLGAACSNSLSRRALSAWLHRVVFSDPRAAPPLSWADYPTDEVRLSVANLRAAIQASCSIPLWLRAVHDIPGAPAGAHWDGGITDYHLHLNYASMGAGLVLYPHFQDTLVPGWLDKQFVRRHRATPRLDNLVLLAPSDDWIRTLPGGKLPDRADFKAFGEDETARMRAWGQALAASQQLADEFAAWTRLDHIDAQALP